MSGAHEILIVEDEPVIARGLAATVRALGWAPTVVDNAKGAAEVVAARDFCGALVDLRLPSEPGAIPLAVTGFTLIKDVLRVRFGRFDPATGKYVVPIVVVSGETEPRSVSLALELGGDAFVDKASLDDPTILTSKLEERMRIAGRADHATCGRLSAPPPAASGVHVAKIAIDGRKRGSRTVVLVNGQQRELSSAKFLPFLRLSAQRMRHAEAWGSRAALGLRTSRSAGTRLREIFDGLVPDGFDVLEWDRKDRFRWNPAVEVERIDWEALAVHSDAPVRKLAAEHLGKREKKKPDLP